jgi:mono/diheme cytochrome c family protein
MRHIVVLAVIGWAGVARAGAPASVDFARDVQPIFQEHCFECHGPAQQRNGLRLDRRRDALRGGTGPMIGPGNAAGSRLYLRLAGDRYGTRMPPFDPLKPEQIATIKAWIDQGAAWPDELSGDVAPAAPDPTATRFMEALRNGDGPRWRRLLRDAPGLVKRSGPGGSTPLMFAVLYGDLDAVRLVLEAGASPNVRNEAGATALMWATAELEKMGLLLDHGADPKVRSNDARTPVLIAAGQRQGMAAVKLLLERGAAVTEKGIDSPLAPALARGDEPLVRLLLERGAELKTMGPEVLASSVRSKCAACTDLLVGALNQRVIDRAAVVLSPPLGDAQEVPALLDRGANPNAVDGDGRSLLMLAAAAGATDTARALLAHGASVGATSLLGESALQFGLSEGEVPVVTLLREGGARGAAAGPASVPQPQPAGSPAEALGRALPLLQRTAESFRSKSGCISCHHNSLTAMTLSVARQRGIAVDEPLARRDLAGTAAFFASWRERVLQGRAPGGRAPSLLAMLVGFASENGRPDTSTDAMIRYIVSQQGPDGSWVEVAHRPPSSNSRIQATAAAVHALKTYAPAAPASLYAEATRRAIAYLLHAQPDTTDQEAYLLLGLHWAGLDTGAVARKVARNLRQLQRADGGWAQAATMESDAFATGQVLFALRQSGHLLAGDPAYQRGVRFLLARQLGDGSWYVKTRSIPLQPYFESGFPHGRDQWVSAAATNWASMALAAAITPPHPRYARSSRRDLAR